MPRPLECDVQRSVVDALVASGFGVEEIGLVRTGGSTGYQGNDPGATDINVRHPSWPRAFRLHIELKRDLKEARTLRTSRDRRKVLQWAAYEAGASRIAWDLSSALSAVLDGCIAARGGAERLSQVMESNGWAYQPFSSLDAALR